MIFSKPYIYRIPGNRPETPLIGIQLPHVPYVRCPATDEMIPVEGCPACEVFNFERSTFKNAVCHYVDDNPELASVIRNKEQIIAACIRGPSGYGCMVWADGEVDERDRG